MILRAILFVLIAAGLLGFGLVAWVATRHPATASGAPPATVTVLAAAHPVQAGALLKPEDLVAQKAPTGTVPDGASPDTPDARQSLVGAMVRHSLAANEIIMPRDVLRPGEHGFLAAVLDPGMRAVTVAVDPVSGTAGLIWPGDRVDVILTQTLADRTVSPDRQTAAETLLSDIRVLAIDQRLVEGAAPGDPAGKEARTVTLEVTPRQSERVAVAVKLGSLSLAVRSAERSRNEPAANTTTIWAGDVSPALAARSSATLPRTVRVFQGAADGREFHF